MARDSATLQAVIAAGPKIVDILIFLPYDFDRGLDIKLEKDSYVFIIENERTNITLSKVAQMFGRSSRRSQRSQGCVCVSEETMTRFSSIADTLASNERVDCDEGRQILAGVYLAYPTMNEEN